MPGVCLSVCLSVCLASHLRPDLDAGILRKILQHCEIGHFFLKFDSPLQKDSSDLHENLLYTYPWTRKSPLNVGSGPDLEFGSRLKSK